RSRPRRSGCRQCAGTRNAAAATSLLLNCAVYSTPALAPCETGRATTRPPAAAATPPYSPSPMAAVSAAARWSPSTAPTWIWLPESCGYEGQEAAAGHLAALDGFAPRDWLEVASHLIPPRTKG